MFLFFFFLGHMSLFYCTPSRIRTDKFHFLGVLPINHSAIGAFSDPRETRTLMPKRYRLKILCMPISP